MEGVTFTDLSSVVFEADDVTDLSANFINQLSEIDQQIGSHDIKILKLRQNNISNFEGEFFINHPHIKYLDVSENALSDIKGIENIPELVLFDASKNMITSIEHIEKNPNLKRLLRVKLALIASRICHRTTFQADA